MTPEQKADFITTFREKLAELMDLTGELNAAITEYGDLGYAPTGTHPLTDADFTGANTGITAAAFAAGLNSTNTLYNALHSGQHAYNIQAIKGRRSR